MNSVYLPLSDEEVLALIHDQSDETAFAELYERYFRPLFNYTYSKVGDEFSAQEIVQELFVSVWQQRDRFSITACRPYLFSAAKKLIISHYRKEFTRQRHYDVWKLSRQATFDPTDQELLTGDLERRYEQSLLLLPPKCREVFVLSRKGKTNQEIAAQLTISEKTVEQHITKALRLLKSYLREHFAYALLLLGVF